MGIRKNSLIQSAADQIDDSNDKFSDIGSIRDANPPTIQSNGRASETPRADPTEMRKSPFTTKAVDRNQGDEAMSSFSQSGRNSTSIRERGMRAVLRLGAGSNQDNIKSPEFKARASKLESDYEIHGSMSSIHD